jgi:hypothetical protein
VTSFLNPTFIGPPENCPQCGALIVDSREAEAESGAVERLRMSCGAVWLFSPKGNISRPIEPCLDAFDNGFCPG